MTKPRKTRRVWPRKVVNLFGGIAYMVVIFQWVIAGAFFIPSFEQLQLAPKQAPVTTAVETSATPDGPTLFTFIGVAVIVLVMLMVTIYVIAKLPATLARSGRKVVHKSSSALTGVVIKATKKKDTKKLRDKLTPKIILYLKLVVVILPLVLAYLSQFQSEPLIEPALALYISALLADMSIFFFIVQYVFARILQVKPVDIW